MTDTAKPSWPELMQMMADNSEGQFKALGIKLADTRTTGVTMMIPWQDHLVGDPETGILHGGVVTTLVDSVCGYAVMSYMQDLVDIATLDLRIDYLKPALPQQNLYASGEVYRMTRNIAFVRATAYQTEGDPVANCVSTFMMGANTGVLPKRRNRDAEKRSAGK